MSLPYTSHLPLLSAVTVDTTGETFDVSKRQLKSIQFICSGHTSGSGAFTLEISNDGTNWVTYNRLISNVTNTNTQGDIRTSAPTLSTNTSAVYFFPTSDYFTYIRATVDVTTDGVYTALLEAAG
jgi:hypothetical protein